MKVDRDLPTGAAYRSGRRAQALVFLACVTASGAVHSDGFRHPGILLDRSSIEATKLALSQKDPLKTAAMDAMLKSPLTSLGYTPKPHAKVICGPYSRPDIGCSDEIRDAQAAYTQALLWAYLGDERHARKAAEIMDAWANTLSGGHENKNAPLQASWSAQLWTRAAEIVRHTSSVWPAPDAQRFGDWLLKQYLPDINRMGACYNGNWHASAIEARMNIGVYTDRRDLYDGAVRQWRRQVPAYIYMQADGERPITQPGCNRASKDVWFRQESLASGIAQETCRDLAHTAFGLSAFFNAAETDRLQGGNLFQQENERLAQAMEFPTGILNAGKTPEWLCGGKLQASMNGTLEIGYAELHGRMGKELPNTAEWLSTQRPSRGHLHFLWETLTHGIKIEDPHGSRRKEKGAE